MNTNYRIDGPNNNTDHIEWTFSDGTVFVEKHRRTIGGYANMIRRVEERMGGQVRYTGTEGNVGTLNGLAWSTQYVETY